MHIPDGYLSPLTSLPVLAAMIPEWGIALRKIGGEVGQRKIPLLALCAAFAFTLMMFNVPVIGGSSAHAVGAVLVAILVGPWAASISISVALLIQALFFGDGGILAFGVNCLNMAVIMPFAGCCIYRLVAGKAPGGSKRNLAGAFAGGYVGLALAAFFAALEFGIQPLLFKAASGAPLYCPYPLSVTLPAMMVPHLLIVGPIEGLVTVLVLAAMARYAPELLRRGEPADQPGKRKYGPLFAVLGALALLTPLGLLAQNTAWGEWGTDELKTMLGYIPAGLEKLSDKWHSLFPDYSVPFLGTTFLGASAGYVVSALVGIALVSLVVLLATKLIVRGKKEEKE